MGIFDSEQLRLQHNVVLAQVLAVADGVVVWLDLLLRILS